MKIIGSFTVSIIVLLCIQQTSQGQLQPGYSPMHSTAFNHSNQYVTQPDLRSDLPQQTYGTDQINWASVPATSSSFINETQPAVWCDAEDGTCSHDDPRCSEFWEHRTRLFGDFLYLTARDSKVPYATHVDGPVSGAALLAPTSVIEPDYESGFRVGGAFALDPWSSITATFWSFRSEISDSLVLPGNIGWARSEVTHPGTASVANDSLFARATDEISFKMGDLAFQRAFYGDCAISVNWLLGLRYAQLNQQFHSDFAISGATTVDTSIDFDGIGPRFGVALERRLNGGFLTYGQAFGNVLFGKQAADYIQQNATAGVQATSDADERRIVPQLELELGMGWQNYSGNLRLRAGYYFATWFNVATTPTWIDAVQANSESDVENSLIFHGLSIRAEYRF